MSNEYTLPSGNACIGSDGLVNWDLEKGGIERWFKEAMQELAKLSAQTKPEPRPELPWHKIADGTAEGIAVHGIDIVAFKKGFHWTPISEEWYEDNSHIGSITIATRPALKLSDELRKELEAFKGKTVDEVLGGENV